MRHHECRRAFHHLLERGPNRTIRVVVERRGSLIENEDSRAPEDRSFNQALRKFEDQYNAAWQAAIRRLRDGADEGSLNDSKASKA